MELSILDDVVKEFGHHSSKELVDITYSPHSAQQGVLEDLLKERAFTTDYKIDFNTLLDEDGREIHAQHLEYIHASQSLK